MKKFEDYLKIKAAAKYLGVTPNTLRAWEKYDKLKTLRHPVNGYRLYNKEDLDELLLQTEKLTTKEDDE